MTGDKVQDADMATDKRQDANMATEAAKDRLWTVDMAVGKCRMLMWQIIREVPT